MNQDIRRVTYAFYCLLAVNMILKVAITAWNLAKHHEERSEVEFHWIFTMIQVMINSLIAVAGGYKQKVTPLIVFVLAELGFSILILFHWVKCDVPFGWIGGGCELFVMLILVIVSLWLVDLLSEKQRLDAALTPHQHGLINGINNNGYV